MNVQFARDYEGRLIEFNENLPIQYGRDLEITGKRDLSFRVSGAQDSTPIFSAELFLKLVPEKIIMRNLK